jgi:DNA-directed RNA polymerase subunit RPC12/RpoP
MEEEIIGVSVCTNCNKRFRIRKQNEKIVGKTVQCPKCHRSFVVTLEPPTDLESAAIRVGDNRSAETEEESSPKKRQRRKKAELRTEICAQIKTEMRPLIRRLKSIVDDQQSTEEKIRQWCVDVLRNALGYTDEDLDFEAMAMSQRIDIAVKIDGVLAMIVECKNTRIKVDTAKAQAANYAIKKSVDWALTSNGHVWKLYRVVPVKGSDPKTVEVFDVALFDEDGLSSDDIQNLYLLSKRAISKGETEAAYHFRECLSNERLVLGLRNPRVISALRKSLVDQYCEEAEVKAKVSDDDVLARLDELYLPPSL